MASQYPAGWYDDPWHEYHQRYWDGTAWTTHGRTAPPPMAGGVVSYQQPSPQPTQPAQQPVPQPAQHPAQPVSAWPAAWYDDPWAQAEKRWWDGNAWTTHLHGAPVQVAPPVHPGEPAAPAQPAVASQPTDVDQPAAPAERAKPAPAAEPAPPTSPSEPAPPAEPAPPTTNTAWVDDPTQSRPPDSDS